MMAFEISINGNPLYTIGVGNVRHIQLMAICHRSTGIDGMMEEHSTFASAAVSNLERMSTTPPYESLKVGDEITVRLVETGAVWIPDDSAGPTPFDPPPSTDKPFRPSTDEPFRLFPD